MNAELKSVQDKYRQERLSKDALLSEINKNIPYESLSVRDVEARKMIFDLRGLSREDCIKAISKITPHQIVWTKVNNDEINSVLEFLNCKYRGMFAYGCSSPMWKQSSWGYFHVDRGINTIQEIKTPKTSIDALVLLLSLDK